MLPNFVLAGITRGGTTSLYYYLKQHPEIGFPDMKEPKYFSSLGLDLPQKGPGDINVYKKMILSFEDYQKLYKNIDGYKVVGDASSPYLYHYDVTAKAIKEKLGDVPILVMLRNPIERAYSAYSNHVRDGRENETFEKALELENSRVNSNWDMMWAYKDVGRYAKPIEVYLATFSKVKVLIFDEFIQDPQKYLKEIFIFLGVDPNVEIDTSQKYSHSGKPKNWFFSLLSNKKYTFMGDLRKIVMSLVPRKYLEKIASKMFDKSDIDPKIREQLQKFYKKDVEHLEQLINKDLSYWK